jgi:hypothetical protein
MAKLDEALHTENSFYSVRSDGSTLLVLKIRNAFPTSLWMLVRTNTQKQVRSDHWAFSKLGDKETVSFPVVSTDELQEKIQAVLDTLKEREQETKIEQEKRTKEIQELLDQKEQALETRIQAFHSDLGERQQTIQSEHTSILAEVQVGGEQIKGEAKYFQVTLKENRDTAFAEIGRQVQQVQTLVETTQHSIEAKEQALSGLVATQTHELGEQVKTLQTDLAEQQPLSTEKYRQDAARKAFWLSLWLVIAAVVFFALTLLAPLLPSANTVLIEIFGSVSAILALIISGITFFLRTKNA